jgi:GNAT superfamily N-acetyltransferase
MRIATATPDQLDTLVAFRDEAAEWLASRGIDQWQQPWPTEDLMVEGILRNVRAGDTFIVWDDGTPAATITVDRWANPDLWTEQEAAEPALYAHKVTVARAYAGQGLGAELLDWAGTQPPMPAPSGFASTCGRPTSDCRSTTSSSASLTSVLSTSRTTRPARCSNGQPDECRHQGSTKPRLSSDQPATAPIADAPRR